MEQKNIAKHIPFSREDHNKKSRGSPAEVQKALFKDLPSFVTFRRLARIKCHVDEEGDDNGDLVVILLVVMVEVVALVMMKVLVRVVMMMVMHQILLNMQWLQLCNIICSFCRIAN